MYRDPFKVGEHDLIVVCDTHKPDGTPTESNIRYLMQEAVDRTKEHEPWFGIEQEYTLLDIDERPFGWPENGMKNNNAPPTICCSENFISCSSFFVSFLCLVCRLSRTARTIL